MTDHNTAGGTPVKETAKRAKWSAEQRKAAVLASLAAGASINEVAERFGVQPSQLSTWRRKYAAAVGASKSTTKTAQFAAVRVKEAAFALPTPKIG
jgi:transposase-like protein